jgi:hypothetical protein
MDIRDIAPFIAVGTAFIADHFPVTQCACLAVVCFVCGLAIHAWYIEWSEFNH